MALKGYKRVTGSARRYLTPSGKEISRYEYDSIRAREAGFKNRGELERFRTGKGAAWEFRLLGAGKRGDWTALGNASQVEKRRARLPKHATPDGMTYRDDSDDPDLVSADGPLADLLVALGYRDAEDYWNVGETNGATR